MSSVTVVIPTYNRARSVVRALRSVADQTVAPKEVVVCDDCSTDNTVDVVEALRGDLPFDLVLVRLPSNLGPAGARNTGIARARGDLVAFLDSDDAWSPTKLEKQVAFLEARPDFVGVGCNGTIIFADGTTSQLKPGFVYEREREVVDMMTHWYIVTSCFVVRRQALLVAGLFDFTLGQGEDRDLFMRLLNLGHVGFVEEDLMTYWSHEDSITGQDSYNTGVVFVPVVEKAVRHWQHALTRDQRRKILAQAHYIAALDAAVAGGVGRTLHHIGKATLLGYGLKACVGAVLTAFRQKVRPSR